MGDTGFADLTISSCERAEVLESDAQCDAPEAAARGRTETVKRLLNLVSELRADELLAFLQELQERHAAPDQADA